MIELVIDTSIYRRDPWRRRAGFRAIERLAKSGRLTLHMPYFVSGEFVSQQTGEYEKLATAVDQAVSDLQRRPLPSGTGEKLQELRGEFSGIYDQICEYPRTEFFDWLDSVKAVMHPVSDSHGARVAKDYFEGAPPFLNKKNRKDIPDAFIWQVILDLSEKVKHLYVVAGDDGICDACNTVQNVRGFSSLEEFLASDVCQPILREENAKENIAKAFRYLPRIIDLRKEGIEAQISESLSGTAVVSNLVPNDTHEAMILRVEELEAVKTESVPSAQYFGEGVIVVPFIASLDATLDYMILVADYHSLSGQRTRRVQVTQSDNRYYAAEETYTLEVLGNLVINVNSTKILEPELTDLEARELIDNAGIEVDSIIQVDLKDWDPINNRWEQRYLELVRYRREHGDCLVPQRYPENEALGKWVQNQRQSHRMRKLSPNRTRRLEELGFVWLLGSSHSHPFLDEYVEQLLAYKKIYGHMNVSQLDPDYRKLGKWLNDQRTKKSRGTISKEYEDRLNEIGIVWNVLEARWDQKLSELKAFHEINGHFEVPRKCTEFPKLGDWVYRIMRERPSDERLRKLKEIGYDWEREFEKTGLAKWIRGLGELRAFHDTYGHFDVPDDDEYSVLRQWLSDLKSRKPSEEKLKRLREIGYEWESESRS